MTKKTFQVPRGTRDILPDDQVYFDYLNSIFKSVVKAAGFRQITTPAFEDTNLFVRGVGKETDIVEKEMYTFRDKSDNLLTLRPEGTAPIVRSYLENGMQSWSQPVKLFYTMPMYRYDRPQAGRYREFWQYGLEMIGDKEPLADVMVISTAQRVYRKLGIGDYISLQLNSIGCQKCRPKYIKELTVYYKNNEKKICASCKNRAETNPLRLLDCKDPKCQPVIEDAPQIINFLCPECHEHFRQVLESLDEINVSYEINPRLVRGLDYYSRTVFEFWAGSDGAQNALCGGGRYDGLVEVFGGKSTAALGFAGGTDRTIEFIKSHPEIEVIYDQKVDVFVVQLGSEARKNCLKLLSSFWDEEVAAEGGFDKEGISGQLSIANRLKAKYALIIGQKEAYDKTVIIKEMASGNQEVYPQDKVVSEVKKRLK
ncbi:MAG: histidine--tRNA ligase [Patescibacteria group bacterium]|nr:histidine--tRNA ligase [Patescibacteria group bacterium]